MRAPALRLFDDELVIDFFAGGGGTSTGISDAIGRDPDIAVNHDDDALSMHAANHPNTKHLCSDVFEVDPLETTGGRKVGLFWLSPDCKHHSKAKGGKPVEKKIRGLAWVAARWAQEVGPRVIMLENVEEFEDWGPLDENNRPDKVRKGLTFRRFCGRLRNQGYKVEHRILSAHHFGAPTSRKRLFLVARRDGLPIVWPKPTHGVGLLPYRTAAECIDWAIPCPSIFLSPAEAKGVGVRRPLAGNTERRIFRGIDKFVVNNPKPFIVPLTHQGGNRLHDIDEPMRTITGAHRGELAVVTPFLTEHANGSKQRIFDVEEPMRTQCAETRGGHFAMVAPVMVPRYGEREGQAPRCLSVEAPMPTIVPTQNGAQLVVPLLDGVGGRKGQSPETPVDKPYHTITAKNDSAVVAAHISPFYGLKGNEVRGTSPDEPLQTQTGDPRFAVVAAAALAVNTTGHPGGAADEPLKTITTGGHHALVAAHMAQHNGGFYEGPGRQMDLPLSTITGTGTQQNLVASSIVKLKGTCRDGQPVDEPLHTIQAGGNHYAEVRAFLIKFYSEGGQWNMPSDPMPTLPTKDRIGLVMVHGEPHVIVDIGMRMLQPRELFLAQGFKPTYIIARGHDGRVFTKEKQVRMCGNSVCPPMAKAMVLAQFGVEQEAVAA